MHTFRELYKANKLASKIFILEIVAWCRLSPSINTTSCHLQRIVACDERSTHVESNQCAIKAVYP